MCGPLAVRCRVKNSVHIKTAATHLLKPDQWNAAIQEVGELTVYNSMLTILIVPGF